MKNDMKMCGISIKKDLHKRILAEAKKRKPPCSFSALLSQLASDQLDALENPPVREYTNNDYVRDFLATERENRQKKAGK